MNLDKPLKEMTDEEIEMEILIRLTFHDWYDITGEEGSDPEAAQSLGVGLDTPLQPIWIFSRYEDDGDRFSLVGSKVVDGVRRDFKAVTKEQFKLEWAWEQIQKRRQQESSDAEGRDLRQC
jgi:hypothetical protein